MRDLVIACVCGAAMMLVPQFNEPVADAGLVRTIQRTRTVSRCEDNCPVTATIEVPTPVAEPEVAIVEYTPVVTRTVSQTSTVFTSGGQCCRRAPVRRVLAGTGRIVWAPFRAANNVRCRLLENRANCGNKVAQARVRNRACRGW